MRDLIEARLWDEHGHRFSDDLHRLFASVKVSFERLAAIQFDAPWRQAHASADEPAEAAPSPGRIRIAAAAFSALLTTLVASLAVGSGLATAQPPLL